MFRESPITTASIDNLSRVPAKVASRHAIIDCLDQEIPKSVPITALTFSGPGWPFEELLCSKRKVRSIVSLEHNQDIYAAAATNMGEMKARHRRTKWDIQGLSDARYLVSPEAFEEGFNFLWLDWMGKISGCHYAVLEHIALQGPSLFRKAWCHGHPAVLAVTIATIARNKEVLTPIWDAYAQSTHTIPFDQNLLRLDGLTLCLNQWGKRINFLPINYYKYRGYGADLLVACWSVVGGGKLNPDSLVLNRIHELKS